MKTNNLYRIVILILFANVFLSASVLGFITVEKNLVSPADETATIGEMVNFQVTISNPGRQDVISLKVTDTWYSGYLEFVSAQPPPDVVMPGQGVIIWNDLTEIFGDLEPGQTMTISVNFVAVGISAVAPAINTVTVEGMDQSGAPVNPAPVSASVNIMQECADDPWEPNGPDALAKIPVGEEIFAFICPPGDADHYSASIPEAGMWTVRLYNLPENYDLFVYIGRILMGSSENTGTIPESVTINLEAPDDLRIVVEGKRSYSYTEPYNLKIYQPGTTGQTNIFAPGSRSNIIMDGLPPGDPEKPNYGKLYFDKISQDTFLGQAPILPDGRLISSVKLGEDTSGDHVILTEIVQDDKILGVAEADIAAKLLKAKLHLWIDDAWMLPASYMPPIVNKVLHPDFGSFGETIVDVCCYVEPVFYSENNAQVDIIIEGDKFGTPENVYRRNGFGGDLVMVPYVNRGGGVYSAILSDVQEGMDRQLVFRFRIPRSIHDEGLIDVTGKLYDMEQDLMHYHYFPRQIRPVLGASTVIFANRRTLFRDHTDAEVAELLGNLYIHSDAWWKNSPLDRQAMIYYVDQYRNENVIRNWDNTSINYGSSEWSLNEGARLIHQFMINRFIFYTPVPKYIMIVGNDEQFPLYRYNDPTNDEQKWITSGANNPAMTACFNDYILTDNYYGDWFMGKVSGLWQDGNIDLMIGRIIGDSAEDMLQLYLNGLNVDGGTARAVMASVDGWELGFEPDDGRPGEIGDLISVPLAFSLQGFQVRNDYESPRTIDVLEPYPSNWATSFQSAANGGMDLFFIGGHNGYTGATLPYDSFGPSDIPSKYHRFDDDNPIVMIVGCHGGLPVPDIGGWNGGANTSMVYNVIHNGARAYYGASGYSYGSPGSLHWCTWGELLLQYNFYYFLGGGSKSKTLGYALQRGKMNFPFGVGNNTNLDRKTVNEFNLFGVPWQILDYPGGSGGNSMQEKMHLVEKFAPAPLKKEKILMISPRKISKLADDVYEQSFMVETSSWNIKDFEGFSIIDIPGGEQQFIQNAPVLPAITKHSIALSPEGKILGIQVDGITTTSIGMVNAPNVEVGAWSESGLTFTDESDINYFYPPEIAYSHEGIANHRLISVFPVRHNPTSKETVLHPNLQVKVTYESPVPFGILDFIADESIISRGTMPVFTARIFNTGDEDITLDGTLGIKDLETGDSISTTTLTVPLTSGTIYDFQKSAQAPPENGSYRGVLTLRDTGDNIVVADSEFSIISAELKNIKAVWKPLDGKGDLSVDAGNLSGTTKTLSLAFVVMNGEGVWLETIYTPAVTVGGGVSRTIPATWIPDPQVTDIVKIQAIGSLDGVPMNNAETQMFVFSPDDLLANLIEQILGRIQLQPQVRNILDLNDDQRIDAADVITHLKHY